jgi:cytochrome c-type biogenesis protein CcmH
LAVLLAFTAAADQRSELGVDARRVIGEPAASPLAGAALEGATHELASRMRCPVCQGLSVADSPADSAVAMRDEVKALLAMGFTSDQVIEYFELSYGEFIRLEPKPEGFNLLVWIVPLVALAAGITLVALRLRAPAKSPAAAAEEDPELEAYRERVREEVAS